MFRLAKNAILAIALLTGCTALDGDNVEPNRSAAQQMRPEALAELYNFDGLDDYVEFAHSNDYLLDNGTLTLWFKAEHLDGRQALFSKDSLNFDTGGHLNIGLDGNRIVVRLQSTNTNEYIRSPRGLVTAGAWQHLAFTWGADGMKLYMGGVLAGLDSYTGGLGRISGRRGNFEPITLGASQQRSGDQVANNLTHFFAGSIKGVAIHDTALSAANIAKLYEDGSGAI